MAYFFSGQSHTFNEYLLVPGYSSSECIPDNVSLRTPLTRFRAGEEPALSLNVPMVSAVMQSVSGDRLAVALAQEGGVSFLYGSQSIEDEAAMVARVKSYKAGFVQSDSNISPDATLADILAHPAPESLLLPVDTLFAAHPALTLTPAQEKCCRNGASFTLRFTPGRYRLYAESGEFLALGEVRDGRMETVKSFFAI